MPAYMSQSMARFNPLFAGLTLKVLKRPVSNSRL